MLLLRGLFRLQPTTGFRDLLERVYRLLPLLDQILLLSPHTAHLSTKCPANHLRIYQPYAAPRLHVHRHKRESVDPVLGLFEPAQIKKILPHDRQSPQLTIFEELKAIHQFSFRG